MLKFLLFTRYHFMLQSIAVNLSDQSLSLCNIYVLVKYRRLKAITIFSRDKNLWEESGKESKGKGRLKI